MAVSTDKICRPSWSFKPTTIALFDITPLLLKQKYTLMMLVIYIIFIFSLIESIIYFFVESTIESNKIYKKNIEK